MSFVQIQAGATVSLPFAPGYGGWAAPLPFQNSLLQGAGAIFKPQDTELDAAGKTVVNAVLDRLGFTSPRNFDYDFFDIPSSYYSAASQSSPLDKTVASELGTLTRNGAAMRRSNGIQSNVQPGVLETSGVRDGIAKPELRSAISTQEVLHENILAYNAQQSDPKKMVSGPLNEVLGEYATFKINPRYAVYYDFMTAMNSDILKKYALAKKNDPSLPDLPGSNQIPQDYDGISLVARDAMKKILPGLGLSDGSANTPDQQMIDAMEKSAYEDPALTPRQQFDGFVARLGTVSGKTPQQIDDLFQSAYASTLERVVDDSAKLLA